MKYWIICITEQQTLAAEIFGLILLKIYLMWTRQACPEYAAKLVSFNPYSIAY